MAYHNRNQRDSVLVCHRRYGKTVGVINDMVKRSIEEPMGKKRNDCRYAYIAPFRSQAKDIAWDYVKKYAGPIPGVTFNESELRCDMPNGSRIRLYGAENADALRGLYFDGVVLDEPADMAGSFYKEVVSPTLLDKQGWCTWIGTPKGRNAFYNIWTHANEHRDRFFTMMIRASESGVLLQGDLENEKIKIGDDVYNQEYECDFSAAVRGSIYGKEVQKAREDFRVKAFAIEKGFPVYTFWDIGQSDYTCVWFVQFIGRDICLCDYYSANKMFPAHYANKVMAWRDTHQVTIGGNYLPHDAANAGPSGRTYMSYLQEAGLSNMHVVPRTPDVWLGIHELRSIFPRVFIHSDNCGKQLGDANEKIPSGIDCLEYYHTREKSDNGIISEQPVHDEFSHGADAIRTMAEAYRLGMIVNTSHNSPSNHYVKPTVMRGESNGISPIKIRHKVIR